MGELIFWAERMLITVRIMRQVRQRREVGQSGWFGGDTVVSTSNVPPPILCSEHNLDTIIVLDWDGVPGMGKQPATVLIVNVGRWRGEQVWLSGGGG